MNYLLYLYKIIVVEIIFKDQLLLDLYVGEKINNKQLMSNPILIRKYRKTIKILRASEDLYNLSKITGLNYEKLQGNLNRYSSVRIDKKFRLIFKVVYDQIDDEKLSHFEIIKISNHYS